MRGKTLFDHFLVSVVIIPPLLVIAVRLVAEHLPPRIAASAVAWSAAGAALASLANLAVFALKAVAEIPPVGRVLGWSAQVVADDTAHEPWVSSLSVLLLAAATVSLVRTWRRQDRLLSIAGRSDEPVVLVPDPAAHAYAVPGRPGHVVVTTGMRDALSAEQFAALLAHEKAHLDARHHRLVRVSELASAAHPALWWVTRQVDYLVERAADECAATVVGSRRTVAEAIGIAALAATPRPAVGLHAAGGVVPRRVSNLLRPPGRRTAAILCALPVALAAFSLIWTGEAAYDLGELLHAAMVVR
ncbi:M56 family metallopeptidase [Actinoplanes missouriensis]|uniref:M56 family metallopeptidase n=1 Tax=Actinoplanes missouriensis TaxID=1866 RepID=UPI001E4CDFEE|nr:M56 family metallopeptidase [Actinoplanes missouriensis]